MSVWCIVIPALENSPMVQWLGLHAFFSKWAGSLPRVQTGELRSHKLWRRKKKKKPRYKMGLTGLSIHHPHHGETDDRCDWRNFIYKYVYVSLMAQWVKNSPATYSAGDADSVSGLGRAPGKGMAAHSSILAWRIPWTEELVGSSQWGHTVKHDWSNLACVYIYIYIYIYTHQTPQPTKHCYYCSFTANVFLYIIIYLPSSSFLPMYLLEVPLPQSE